MKNPSNKKKLEGNKNKKSSLKLSSVALKTCVVLSMASVTSFLGLAISDTVATERASNIKENPSAQYQPFNQEAFDNAYKGFMGTFVASSTAMVLSASVAGLANLKDQQKKAKESKEKKEKEPATLER